MNKKEITAIINDFFEFIDNGTEEFHGKIYRGHPGLYFFHSRNEFEEKLEELIKKTNKEKYNKYDIYYITSKLIKFLLGKYDSHTKVLFQNAKYLPIELKIKDGGVYITNITDEMNSVVGSKITYINGVPIETILYEIEEITCYGTTEYLNFNQEKAIMNGDILRSLPSIKDNVNIIEFTVIINGTTLEVPFDLNNLPKGFKLLLKENYSYEIINDTIIINYNSCEDKEKMTELVKQMAELTSKSGYKNFIIDIRDNLGGDSSIIGPLLEFLKDKNIVVLINEKVFSSGRMAFVDLKNIGAYSIGTDICTPLNCFGFNRTKRYNDLGLTIRGSAAYWYYNEKLECTGFYQNNFSDYFKNRMELLNPIYLGPDEYVELSIEDIINNNDKQLERALAYFEERKLNK